MAFGTSPCGNMTLNGKKVPALGYLAKDVSAPSFRPEIWQ